MTKILGAKGKHCMRRIPPGSVRISVRIYIKASASLTWALNHLQHTLTSSHIFIFLIIFTVKWQMNWGDESWLLFLEVDRTLWCHESFSGPLKATWYLSCFHDLNKNKLFQWPWAQQKQHQFSINKPYFSDMLSQVSNSCPNIYPTEECMGLVWG